MHESFIVRLVGWQSLSLFIMMCSCRAQRYEVGRIEMMR